MLCAIGAFAGYVALTQAGIPMLNALGYIAIVVTLMIAIAWLLLRLSVHSTQSALTQTLPKSLGPLDDIMDAFVEGLMNPEPKPQTAKKEKDTQMSDPSAAPETFVSSIADVDVANPTSNTASIHHLHPTQTKGD